MKKVFLASIALLVGSSLQAQILKPVKWSYAAKKTSPTEAVVYLKATLDPGWHVYSQHVKEGGPVATSFKFTPGSYALLGPTQEPTPITKLEKVFGMEVSYFEKQVIFQQKLKLTGKTPLTVKGTLEYMVCDDKQCLPPEEVSFTVPVK
ncbi:protein-disulfide reductase DsbD N-terminal domain-containing protein [Siphonobacter curvatus]|uniref:Sugar transporter n=1 Tax=Siphonobacter curvatus TaxID=2094562 RepID=A0A2S7IKK3_9BACT|nr:protein-disulfide reductase DsbD N-terminal domain-containing protein [Siphonobacter curvatus]PQA57026.1 sugar transporter [Siphonobacter curvatus]